MSTTKSEYTQLCTEILDAVGGSKNIRNVFHCITRLRIVPVNRDAVDMDKLSKVSGILKVVESSGQIQCVIGTTVPEVYEEFLAVSGVAAGGAVEAEPATDEPVDEVDAFIADFAIPADRQEFAPDAGEQTAPAEPAEPAQPEEAEAPAESDEDDSAPVVIEEEDDEEYDDEYYDDEEYEPVRKPRVFLLILYILLAVPVGLLGILLLIVPTLLFLVLSGLIITGGVMAVTSAFGSGIAVFADIMVIIGMAFILLALGLLALWIAVWLVGGAMVGLVRGLIHLGGKWCYKEVEA